MTAGPSEGGWQLRVVGSSMTPTFESGDALWVEPCRSAALAPGEVVVFVVGSARYAHRVRLAGADGTLVTRGDACQSDDAPVPGSAVLGRAVAVRREPGPWRPLAGASDRPAALLRGLAIQLQRARLGSIATLDALGLGLTARRALLAVGAVLGRQPPPVRALGAADLPELERLLGLLRWAGREPVPTLDEVLELRPRIALAAPGPTAGPLRGAIGLRMASASSGAVDVAGPWLHPGRGSPAVARALVDDLLGGVTGAGRGRVAWLRAVPRSQWLVATFLQAGFRPVVGSPAPGRLLVRAC